MTDNEINEQVAMRCGWKETPIRIIGYMWRPGAMTTGRATWENPQGEPMLAEWLPRYASSLDAIHAEVMKLDESKRSMVDIELLRLSLPPTGSNRLFCELTAKDWCHAFLAATQPAEPTVEV